MLDQEMSGGQDIYSPVPLCVCKVMCMCVSLHIFQQQRPNCSISAGVFCFFLLNFMPLKKNPKGFCLGDCPAFPSQKLGTKNNRAKYSTILLYSNAKWMQIWYSCAPTFQTTPHSRNTSSYPEACSCSYTLEHWIARTLQNKVPSQAASPLLDWRDSSRTRRAQHRYLEVKISSH